VLVLGAAMLLAAPVAAQRGGRPPPPSAAIAPQAPVDLGASVPATAVIVRPGSTETRLQSVRVREVRSLESLRQRPELRLDRDRVDLRPLLTNASALPNVAARLRALPSVVVLGEEARVYELDEGIVVRSVLAYRHKPGSCSDAIRRRAVAAAGARCMERRTPQAIAAAFSDPRDPRFIADPRMRMARVRQAEAAAAETREQIDADIATLRARLADPAGRAAIAAEIGGAEAARLAALDPVALEAEVANAHETRIEQVVFVPREGRLDAQRFPAAARLGGPPVPAPSGTGAGTPSPATQKEIKADYSIDPVIYLTGFTLGRDYEWRERVETTISWCLVGCKKTYYAEAYAGFGYGFGLRFPIRFSADYAYRRAADGSASAELTPRFEPINGAASDYRASGLPEEKLFEGKEFVAQFGAWAGFGYKVPVFGAGHVGAELDFDFTDDLPGDFRDGQFDPPTPGQPGPHADKIFETVDLLGGRANFGVVGAQVFPAVRFSLRSDALRFSLTDNVAPARTVQPESGTAIPLNVSAAQTANFTVESPVYNLGFQLTPGLQARLFIDVEVWSHDWRPTLWFPELAVVLPPGGVDFACHADTTCSRTWHLKQSGAIASTGASSGYMLAVEKWAAGFDADWLSQCADEICRTGMKFVRLNAVLRMQQALAADPNLAFRADAVPLTEAASHARTLVHESHARLTQKASHGWTILAQAVWTKRCSDLPCVQNVATLAAQMGQAAVDLQKQRPDDSSLAVQGEVNRAYGKKFQAEIDASTARTVAAALQKLPAKPVTPSPIILAPKP
jgi:hypothetical protein